MILLYYYYYKPFNSVSLSLSTLIFLFEGLGKIVAFPVYSYGILIKKNITAIESDFREIRLTF